MSRSATFSSTLAFLLCAAAAPAAAQSVLTQEEALALAFPRDAAIERRTAYLEPAQLAAAQRAAGSDVEVVQRVITYYVATRAGRAIGVAYFDSHRVRTLPEVIMVAVDLQDRVQRIEILKFSEPPEYRAPEKWLDRVEGLELSPDLSTKGKVPPISGATLTANAITRATRRVLALHQVIKPFAAKP